MTDPDDVLIQRFAAAGDAEAFAEIVRRYAGLVFAACHRVVRNRDLAEDASQETFFDLFRNPRSVTGSLAGWLHMVGTRKSIDLVRRDVARQRREADYTSAPDGEDREWKEVSEQIDAALAELDEESRGLLIEHYLLGKTQTELAETHGISQATVSRRLGAGVEALREKLKEKGYTITAASLGLILTERIIEGAPSSLMLELGKMCMAGSAAGVAAVAGAGGATLGAVGIKLAVIASACVVGFAAYIVLNDTAPVSTTSPTGNPAVASAAPSAAQPNATSAVVKRLRLGEQFRFNSLLIRLIRVSENNPDDRNDDHIEIKITDGGAASQITVTEGETTFYGNYQITAENVQADLQPPAVRVMIQTPPQVLNSNEEPVS